MNTYILEAHLGHDITNVSKQAKRIAKDKNIVVEFDFNGCRCLVNKNSDLELLLRDYHNHFIMDWKEIGPDYHFEYAPSVQKELVIKTAEKEERQRKSEEEYRNKDAQEKIAFEKKVTDVTFAVSDQPFWEKQKSVNSDGYGSAIIEYAECWARLMQKEIHDGAKLSECAERTSFELGFLGITGFMYGAAVSILSKGWIHGEDLRKWHNKEYNHEG